MNREQLVDLLENKQQEHLIDYYDRLNENAKTTLVEQIENLDWNLLKVLNHKNEDEKRGVISPIKACTIDEIKANEKRYEEIGLDAIRNGEVAAVLLAGGQGSRLGYNGPKGTVNIGVKKELYIFEMLFKNTMKVNQKAGADIPFYIMTSEKNHKETVEFLEEKNYFGYPSREVHFFTQKMAPCVDLSGQILMESMDQIAFSPNGNGGWFSSMEKNGIIEELKKKNVQWLNVFSVDNVLQKICDPIFLGAVIDANYVSGSKVVKKAAPEERVGVMCLDDGKPSIIEYYEMTKEMLEEKTENGDYAYNYGVILNYLFRIDRLEEIVQKKMPIHFAQKKITYTNKDGVVITPTEPNGYKFEEFILDMVHLLENCLPYEVIRNQEFAPIKNANGVDSIETARKLLVENGVEI